MLLLKEALGVIEEVSWDYLVLRWFFFNFSNYILTQPYAIT